MRALVRRCCRTIPQINARFDDEAGVVHRYAGVHIGIATQTANGLMVPVVQPRRERSTSGPRAAEVARVADAARDGKATRRTSSPARPSPSPAWARSAASRTTPVINHPEVAIIGRNKIVERPVVRDGQIVVRKMMNLSSVVRSPRGRRL